MEVEVMYISVVLCDYDKLRVLRHVLRADTYELRHVRNADFQLLQSH